MRKLFFGFALMLIASSASACRIDELPATNSGLLNFLDRELARRDSHIDRRAYVVDSIKNLIDAHPGRRVELYFELGERELRKFGATPDALEALRHVRQKGVFPQNRLLYAETARDLNLYIAEILEDSDVAKSYLNDGMKYAESQLDLLPPDSPEAQIARWPWRCLEANITISVLSTRQSIIGLSEP